MSVAAKRQQEINFFFMRYTNDQNKRTWGNGAFFVFLQYMRIFEQIISRSSRDDSQEEQVNFLPEKVSVVLTPGYLMGP
jgi:hypothetical protein